jgi:hypothetical protein
MILTLVLADINHTELDQVLEVASPDMRQIKFAYTEATKRSHTGLPETDMHPLQHSPLYFLPRTSQSVHMTVDKDNLC